MTRDVIRSAAPTVIGRYSAAIDATSLARDIRLQLALSAIPEDEVAVFVADDPSLVGGDLANTFKADDSSTWPPGCQLMAVLRGQQAQRVPDQRWGRAVVLLRSKGARTPGAVDVIISGRGAQESLTIAAPTTVGDYMAVDVSRIDGPAQVGWAQAATPDDAADLWVSDDVGVTGGSGEPPASTFVGPIVGGGAPAELARESLARRLIVRRTAGTTPLDVLVVGAVDPSGGDGTTGVPGAQQQTTWYVDGDNGDDSADGRAPQTALASLTEYFRRLGSQPIDGIAVTVNVVGDDASPGPFRPVLVNGAHLTIRGTRTVLPAASPPYFLQSAQGWSATPMLRRIGRYKLRDAAAANPDLTALGLAEVCFASLTAQSDVTTPLGKDLGAGEFQGVWIHDGGGADEPEAGQQVLVHQVNALTADRIEISPRLSPGSILEFKDLAIASGDEVFIAGSGGGRVWFNGCSLGVTTVYPGQADVRWLGCHVRSFRNEGARIALLGGSIVYFACITGTGGETRASLGNVIVEQGSVVVGNDGPGHFILSNGAIVAVSDYGTAGYTEALLVREGSTFYSDGAMFAVESGAAAPLGGKVKSGSSVVATSTDAIPYMHEATAPTNDWSVGGATYAQAALPVVNAFNNAMVVLDE